MEYGCPLCNGLADIRKECPRCGLVMDDSGNVEDYYGPYSPYENSDLYEPPDRWEKAEVLPCIHLFACPRCGYDTRIAIAKAVL